MKNEIHKIQANILKVLLSKEEARFTELNIGKVSNDHFTFHIKELLKTGIVEKTQRNLYRLTNKGKEYANRFDVDSGSNVKIEKQAKIGVLVIVSRVVSKQIEYLMQHRLKQPFFGFRGFIVGKIKQGETVFDTANRELLEEAGLKAKLEHKVVYHERIFSKDNELLEDKYFFIFVGKNPKGDLVSDFEWGKNEWVKSKNVLKDNVFYDIKDILKLIKSKNGFYEKDYTVEKY